MRPLVTTTAAFLAVVLTGGAWIGLVTRVSGTEPGLAVALLGAAFTVAFMWLLIQRLRSLLLHPDRRRRELLLLAANFAVLVLAFAWVHSQIGLMDLSGPAPRATRDLGDAVYFSIVTITTLGYGDFIPLGPGRPVAAMQALIGYFILGILVSTGFQLIAPHRAPARKARDLRDDVGEDGGEGDHGGAERDA